MPGNLGRFPRFATPEFERQRVLAEGFINGSQRSPAMGRFVLIHCVTARNTR